jgi:hypothetical protein
MRVLFIAFIILIFVFPVLANESKVYTDDDLKEYKSSESNSLTVSPDNPCYFFQEQRDNCGHKNYLCKAKCKSDSCMAVCKMMNDLCKAEWDNELIDCQFDYLKSRSRRFR